MNKELEKILYAQYPLIFKHALDGTLDWKGIEVGDGWFDLLDVTFSQMYQRLNEALKTQDLYKQMAERSLCVDATLDFHLELATAHVKHYSNTMPTVERIKETNGELRLVMYQGHSEVRTELNMAETMSRRICCVCGASGQLRQTADAVRTLCDTHFDELDVPEILRKLQGRAESPSST